MWSLSTKCPRFLRLAKPTFRYESAESLFSATALGIDRFLESKAKTVSQFANFTDKYRMKMEDFIKEDQKNMIFTEDLRNMIYLTTKKDVNLINLMIKKFNKQNNEMRFGNFIFGPVVMRMYYNLNLPDAALKIFEDPDTANFFDQVICYQILMDLLYKHEKYDDVIKVFEYVKNKQLNMTKYPKNVVVLIMATYYKQNTKESLKSALTLWNDLLKIGNEPLKKAVAFFAGLAINQNSPHIALEALCNIREQKYITIRNLKAIALADLDRPGDVLPILRQALNFDSPNGMTNVFTQDTIVKIEQSVQRLDNKEIEREYAQLLKSLKDGNLIQNEDLDSILCKEVNYTALPRNSISERSNSSFTNNRKSNNYENRRQGLDQMY